MANPKAIAFIQDCFVSGDTPADNCTFIVNFHTADGTYSSTNLTDVDVTQSEAQISGDLKTSVANSLNAGLNLSGPGSYAAADIRLF